MYPSYPMQPASVATPFQSASPYLARLEAMQQPQTMRYEIIHVNGENGARAFRMAPNSQCLLLDDTAPIVWLAITDGAGYPTLTPYTITPYQAAPAPDIGAMNDRISRLEAAIYGRKPDFSGTGEAPGSTAGTDTNVGSKPAANVPAIPAVPAADGR